MSSSIAKEEGILPSSPTLAPKLQRRNNKIWVVILCFLIYQLTVLHFWHPTEQSPSPNCPSIREGLTDDVRRNRTENEVFRKVHILKFAYKTNFLNAIDEA